MSVLTAYLQPNARITSKLSPTPVNRLTYIIIIKPLRLPKNYCCRGWDCVKPPNWYFEKCAVRTSHVHVWLCQGENQWRWENWWQTTCSLDYLSERFRRIFSALRGRLIAHSFFAVPLFWKLLEKKSEEDTRWWSWTLNKSGVSKPLSRKPTSSQ